MCFGVAGYSAVKPSFATWRNCVFTVIELVIEKIYLNKKNETKMSRDVLYLQAVDNQT